MPSHKILWTALPNGVRDGRLQLSALVSPRLVAAASEGDTLSLWPVWEDWTGLLRNATFKVAFDGGPAVDATFDRNTLEPELWRALFKRDTLTALGCPNGTTTGAC